MSVPYPKRLIEVDLPIARISAHARREKSIRHGHISTLHIWWARRPLAACRAVICAALWPDPADPLCPPAFRQAAIEALQAFALRVFPPRLTKEGHQLQETLSLESRGRWEAMSGGTLTLDANEPTDMPILRMALLDFIADFANWDNSTVPAYLETARALTQAAHEALGGEPDTRPLVVDPFAGGGSIPLEALRVGADAFASDLNPVPVLLNKVVLEYIPKYGQRLAEEVRKWGAWIKDRAEEELAQFYPPQKVKLEDYHPRPKDKIERRADGATWYLDRVERETPIAYLWARTILSEAPGQGEIPVEVPLMRSFWLAKKAGRKVALRWVRDDEGRVKTKTVEVTSYEDGNPRMRKVKRPLLEIFEPKKDSEVPPGTVARGSATCPVTGYTTKVASVRAQLKRRRGGANDARLYAVVTTLLTKRYSGRREHFEEWSEQGRFYRLPTHGDEDTVSRAANELAKRVKNSVKGEMPLVPEEPTPQGGGTGAGRAFGQRNYGMDRFADLYASRQLLALTTLVRFVLDAGEKVRKGTKDVAYGDAVQAILALLPGKQADLGNSLCRWEPNAQCPRQLFGRQAISIVWDFAEGVPIGESSGAWEVLVRNMVNALESTGHDWMQGAAQQADATQHPLPDEFASVLFTDPPYYDAVPYSDLADFFFVWLKRLLPGFGGGTVVTPKAEECIVDEVKGKDAAYFINTMQQALAESRRVVTPKGIGIVVFAHKSTSGWESQLQAMLSAGWTVTASWPVDTECGSRLRAMDSAALASSVHLVCRPREDAEGTVAESVGEWRDVLGELPKRIHEWMPRLAAEGVVGADAIFACLGPALEVFSRFSRVEKANGEEATLREYLEHVWAAVSTEALSLIFKDANAAGLEPDARLSAMWLWTIGGSVASGEVSINGVRSSSIANVPDPDHLVQRVGRMPRDASIGRNADEAEESENESDEEESSSSSSKGKVAGGFMLEYDTARKIAQGLGVHLEQCESLVEIKGDKARLLPVAERTAHLFGKGTEAGAAGKGRKKKPQQKTLFAELDEAEAADAGWTAIKGPPAGATVLDRVHQAMILFAANRGELLKRFLVEDGVGKDARFWKLADNLNKLYPPGTDERRWVEGVLARKKGLGL